MREKQEISPQGKPLEMIEKKNCEFIHNHYICKLKN